MNELYVTFNGTEYEVTYNPQSGYYELELTAPQTGGIYNADISFTDLLGNEYTDDLDVQIFEKEALKFNLNKEFIWIFDGYDFSVKDIVEIFDYEIIIDEETNGTSVINILKKTNAKAKDIIVVKKENELIYWGIIEEISNEDGKQKYILSCKYLTNLFDQNIILENESLIRTTGVEDFIADAITNNFISNTDTFVNKSFLQLNVKTHTTKQTSVTNVENGIYNLHTWMTNCTQNYDIVYSFSIVNKKLVIDIENKSYNKILIDTKAMNISDYSEVFETDITAKVVVLYDKVDDAEDSGIYTLYLKTDRTTTTNMNDENRAEGKVETVYTENYEDASQLALDTIKGNLYNHNISFNLLDKYIKIGTPIAIKTKESLIYDTYISSITMTKKRFIKYQCGNIRINFIEKLMKERK